ncbi:MAG: ATP-grasp domain-containing protein, partial [Chloroflexota bacterium]|nr:ATP-grasp domain-containing protein [Chloroflexota bacterium]
LEPLDAIDDVRRAADEVGYPVALKAVAGGGGKGLRMVSEPAHLEAAFRQATSEAGAAFGNAAVYLERAIQRPRHVEVQILADEHAHCVWLGERDCSIQRRHQKVLEESPSPAVSPELRAQMGEVAVRAALAAGYTNAGTVEFLLAPDRSFYFLEVNARLQVEHPVTEEVTGIDLVREQLRIASGQVLGYDQSAIEPRGYAVECRIYAEDPSAGFIPSTGRLIGYRPPAGPGVRVDSGVEQDAAIGVHYDPMIAKLIVHAADRQRGLDRMARALREFLILGVRTSIPLHEWLIAHPDVRSGDVDTGWLERAWSPASADALASAEVVETAAIAAALLVDASRGPAALAPSAPGPESPVSTWRVAGRRAARH